MMPFVAQAMGKHKRSAASAHERESKRLAISVDTLLRLQLGLPVDVNLKHHLPIEPARVLQFLRERACVTTQTSTKTTSGYEPNAVLTCEELSPCSEIFE